jgi:hypothetical protein
MFLDFHFAFGSSWMKGMSSFLSLEYCVWLNSTLYYVSGVKARLGYSLRNIKDSFLRIQIHLFLHFSYDMSSISPFFSHFKWNNFVPNFIYAYIISIFFTYEKKNSKIYPMWAMFYQWPKFPKFSFFETFYIAIRHLVLSNSYILCTLVPKVFMVRILGQTHFS